MKIKNALLPIFSSMLFAFFITLLIVSFRLILNPILFTAKETISIYVLVFLLSYIVFGIIKKIEKNGERKMNKFEKHMERRIKEIHDRMSLYGRNPSSRQWKESEERKTQEKESPEKWIL